MILGFKEKHKDGSPTYFPEKIFTALYTYYSPSEFHPKLHTIREDKNNRWKPGTDIHFYANVRQPDMYQFAPGVKVKSVQDIEIRNGSCKMIKIDGEIKYYESGIKVSGTLFLNTFIVNDGFDSIKQFWEWFDKPRFVGRLIIWTDLKY